MAEGTFDRDRAMQEMNSREALLDAVRDLRDEVERVVSGVSEERAEQREPEFAPFGELTFKDVIAHLTAWRQVSAARLEAGVHGREPAFPWPAHLTEEPDVDQINRWFFERDRDKPWVQVLDESRETFERVERAIAAMAEDALLEVGHFSWLEGYALGPAVMDGMLDHHHNDHEPDIRAWLERG